MADVEIYPADEARKIAEQLIPEHHPHLHHFQARILYLFTTQKRQKAGRVVLGTAQRLPALMRYLSRAADDPDDPGADFIILLSAEYWHSLSERQKFALVDHELCHCVMRKGKWALRAHDVEEFAEIIERHGLWTRDLREMGEVVSQLALPIGAELSLEQMAAGHLRNFRAAVEALRPDGERVSEVTISGGGRSVTLKADE